MSRVRARVRRIESVGVTIDVHGIDAALEIGIVRREPFRRRQVRQGITQVALPPGRLGERAGCGEILGSERQHVSQFDDSGIELLEREQRSAECDAGGNVFGVKGETGAAGVDRFVEAAGAAVFLGELRNAIDAGSCWTLRRRSSMRAMSLIRLRARLCANQDVTTIVL
ncbi:MAG: hypothetical protein QM736_19465 [Vicinamibacterales bacterium]